MTQGENLRVLIFEENVSEAESLANLLRSADHSLHMDFISEAGKLETVPETDIPDTLVCSSRESSPDFLDTQFLVAERHPDLPIITITGTSPEDGMVEANHSGYATLLAYDRPEDIRCVFSKEFETLRLRKDLDKHIRELRAAELRCHAFIDRSSDAVAYLHDGMHVYANRSYRDLFAISTREDIEGTPLLDMVDKSQHEEFRTFLRNYQKHPGSADTLRISCLSVGGEAFVSNMEFCHARFDGEDCTQVIIRPCHSAADLEKKLDAMSRNDILTGLYNRQHFMRILEDRVSSRQDDDGACALIYILLDNFKSVRESTGVAASDFLLRDIARLLERHIELQDCAARFGEYSFTLLHHNSSKEKIQAPGEKLLRDIDTHASEIDGHTLRTTCSIGICAITGHSSNAQDVLSRADLACEVARSSGGNRIHTHSVAVDKHLAGEADQNWHKIIRKTIDDNRFYLVYQPIVSLKGESDERYEVLLGVVDEEGHVILPGQFLAIAGQVNLSGEIDRWVINRVFSQLVKMREQNREISFFIKLSNNSLTDARLPDWINQRLEQYRLVSDGIIFEIPELTAIGDLKNSMLSVRSMEKIHCKVALEHYGRSNQPQLLNHLPADFLKIDSSLISNLATSKENQGQVKEIVTLAKSHGQRCVAECVEEAGDLALLWQYGVDFIQGNFVQEPNRQPGYEFGGEVA
ncbi:MAG TPA: EAL domain-containing protein [Gammaproteobacteria bacterium]|nr:EAL domain-containing protein [Gammaproteobacteria bacterium]